MFHSFDQNRFKLEDRKKTYLNHCYSQQRKKEQGGLDIYYHEITKFFKRCRVIFMPSIVPTPAGNMQQQLQG